MQAINSTITPFFARVSEGCSSICSEVSRVAREAIAYVRDYEYRCSAFYGSSFPLALPITLIGMIQCIHELATKRGKDGHPPLHRALAITDLIVGISGLIRPFCITVIALSVISRMEPILHQVAGPLSLVASITNSIYAVSVIIRAVISCRKIDQMRASLKEGETPFHYLSEREKASSKDLSYDFQTDGKKLRGTYRAVASKLDSLDGTAKAAEVQKVTKLFNDRLLHRRLSDALSVLIAVASIVSAVCFFIWAGTMLAPVAWIIALAVCAMSLGKYIYDYKIIQAFQNKLDEFIAAAPARTV